MAEREIIILQYGRSLLTFRHLYKSAHMKFSHMFNSFRYLIYSKDNLSKSSVYAFLVIVVCTECWYHSCCHQSSLGRLQNITSFIVKLSKISVDLPVVLVFSEDTSGLPLLLQSSLQIDPDLLPYKYLKFKEWSRLCLSFSLCGV